jgi:hypothetical protein
MLLYFRRYFVLVAFNLADQSRRRCVSGGNFFEAFGLDILYLINSDGAVFLAAIL